MMSPGAGSGLEVSIVMLFILSLNFTDQGIRNIKESPKRAKVARELAKKIGVEIKQVYLTSGASDLVVLAETENGDNIAKLALAIGNQGNVLGPPEPGLKRNIRSSFPNCPRAWVLR
jgi:uncharacterized protein with GYD domain